MKFGIDLGTTYSLIGRVNGGTAEIIQNPLDESLTTASVVYINGDPPVVGQLAKSYLTDPSERKYVASFVKDYMGQPNSPIFKYPYAKKYGFDSEDLSPIEISALILKELARDAEGAVGEKVED
ncbi:MAG: Hsp70 family protein, partial [Oscillospiraceae bacterium]|nr:Hsp70 family protein [Oscillospiraceae bacterium]